MRSPNWNILMAGLAASAPAAVAARAEIYLTESQAVKVFFPAVALRADRVQLTPDEIKVIEKSSGERVRLPKVRVFWGPKGEALFIDEVLGKHEFITYVVAVNADATVKGIEIMDYRETFGYQVREKEWRGQFIGKSAKDPLRVTKDIKNISGATLSSTHVTAGVRRVLQTYETIKNRIH